MSNYFDQLLLLLLFCASELSEIISEL